MEIVYEPDVCKDPESGVSGHLKVKVPSLLARYEYMDKAGMQIDMKGEVKGGNLIKAVKYLVGVAKDHLVEIKIKTKEREISTYDDLLYDGIGQGVLQEVAMKLMSGFAPGND